MLEAPNLLAAAMVPGDSLVALQNGRDLIVGDVLQIDAEQMVIGEVVSANNYKTKWPVTEAHALNALVYQLPNPNSDIDLNTGFVDPLSRGWFQCGGVWVHGQGLPPIPDGGMSTFPETPPPVYENFTGRGR